MKVTSWILLAVGIVLLVGSITQIQNAAQGLEIIKIQQSSPPTTIISPTNREEVARPVVMIGHGFAGSGLLMRGFAFSLAHAGYTTLSWDFNGHGANPNPLSDHMSSDALVENAEAALDAAIAFGLDASEGIAILGHSMGSGVALDFGVEHPMTAATIAVSPISRTVTPTLPRNLLLMAGSLEQRFVQTAEKLLSDAGGPGGDPSDGTARELHVVRGVEHISILFVSDSHRTAREWLDATFGPQPGAVEYTDRRMMWYGLGMLGVLILGWAVTPLFLNSQPLSTLDQPLWRRLTAPIVGALLATVILWLLGKVGLEVGNLLGLMVGGYLLFWFALAGLISLLFLQKKLSLPSRRALFGGLIVFAVLWFGIGLLAHFVWLPWLLIPKRLVLWPLGALLALPWFLAIGETIRGDGFLKQLLGWLMHTIILGAGFFLALRLIPELFVLILILPVLPLVNGLLELATARLRGSWPFAIGGALFMCWVLLAVFPMA
ncbi:MAG TPA: alpha/beta hydrolase [Anaerolineae bacterium]|nr:alpha/beta hydrolase [Anaerolineae bacterium]